MGIATGMLLCVLSGDERVRICSVYWHLVFSPSFLFCCLSAQY